MNRILIITALVLILLLSGCYTTGLSPREVGGLTYSQLVYGLYTDQPPANETPKLKQPMKLAVAQIGEVSPPAQLLKELNAHPDLISEVIEVPLPGEEQQGYYFHDNEDPEKRKQVFKDRVQTMLTISKQLGADKVLMIGGQIDSRTLSAPIEILDIVSIPAFIIPSKKVMIDAKASGALIDVDTGSVVFLLNTTSTAEGLTPSAYVNQKRESLSVAQGAVLSTQMAEKLIERLMRQ